MNIFEFIFGIIGLAITIVFWAVFIIALIVVVSMIVVAVLCWLAWEWLKGICK